VSSSDGTREASGGRLDAPAETHAVSERVELGIVWLRRDLRLDDNAALAAAARRCVRITCAFVLDPPLLRGERTGAPIVGFFLDSLAVLRERLRALGSDLALLEGDAAAELTRLVRRDGAAALFYNDDTDPAMRARDAVVTRALEAAGCRVTAVPDLVYAPAGEVLADGGRYYRVFTPYRRRWYAFAQAHPQPPIPSLELARDRLRAAPDIGPTLAVPRPETPTRTWRRTTAAGNGRPRPEPMPRRTFASSTRCSRAGRTIRRGRSCAACCRCSRGCPPATSTRPGRCRRWRPPKRAASPAATTPCRSSTTPPPASERWRFSERRCQGLDDGETMRWRQRLRMYAQVLWCWTNVNTKGASAPDTIGVNVLSVTFPERPGRTHLLNAGLNRVQ
jgi:hypothetical protein